MGCCGCSLAASAMTAVVLGLVESIVGMCWNIMVIVILESSKRSDNSSSSALPLETTPFESTELYANDETSLPESPNSYNDSWDDFKSTLVSHKALNEAHIFELSIASLVLNSFWLITTLALAVGNAEKCRGMLRPWIFTTIIVTILDIAATVYFIFKAVVDTDGDTNNIAHLFVYNIFVILATFFSRGGPIIWIANVALCVYVAQRMKEIQMLKKKRLPFDTDLRLAPYSLHHPYETYEADSYLCEKSLRPNTPPPDYEVYQKRMNGGGGGGGRPKKNPHYRRQSLPSEGDASTLPVSMRSGASTRPASTCYAFEDDRVELHHRSAPAKHGYDNRAMKLDHGEEWLGIPRPKLMNPR